MPARQTISESYRDQQVELHKDAAYGVASLYFAPLVRDIVKANGVRSISDYGAGKKNLLVGLRKLGVKNFEYYPYDPAFPEYGPPQKADLVCCIDVLEHIEPECLDAVIAELGVLIRRIGFFSIATEPSSKTLPDGRNAHLIQKPASWWLMRLCPHFEIMQLWRAQTNLLLLVKPPVLTLNLK